MNKQKQAKLEKQKKYFAYVILVLFLGSIVAAALLYGGTRVSLPENPLLGRPLDENQIQLLVQNKGAYIVAQAPIEEQPVLVDVVQRYAPLVYLYGETSNETYIQVTTAKGTKTFSSIDADAIEDYMCEDFHPAIIECQTRKAINDF